MRGVLTAMGLLAFALLAACGDAKTIPATQVIVAITSDLQPVRELSRVQISLSKRDGSDVVTMQDFALVKSKPKTGQQQLPITFAIGKGGEASFLLTVRGYGPLGAGGAERQVVEQKAIATFQDRKTLLLQVFLGRVCLDNLCGGDADLVCYPTDVGRKKAGQCGAIPELDADELESVDPKRLPDLSKAPIKAPPIDRVDESVPDAPSAGSGGEGGTHAPGDASVSEDARSSGGSSGSEGAGTGGRGGSQPAGTPPCVLGSSELGACRLGP